MNFQELCNIIGTQCESDWHQSTGGGWIHKTAEVSDEARITDNAIVWGVVSGDAQVYGHARVYGEARVSGDAQVYGNAQVYGHARVSGDAQVYGHARVSGEARVYGEALVYGDARVSGDAQVYGHARVYGEARVYGDAWTQSPLFIIGSLWSLTNCKHGHIQIGCECHEYSWWKANREAMAKKHDLADEQRMEYFAYIDLFCMIGK